jgi:hypothetical protein
VLSVYFPASSSSSTPATLSASSSSSTSTRVSSTVYHTSPRMSLPCIIEVRGDLRRNENENE